MQLIKLSRSTWEFDNQHPIAEPGGFGTVYRGRSPEGKAVAIKRLGVDARSAAHRELSMADVLVGKKLAHVVDVYDAGLDADTDDYFLVMELAEGSLRDKLLGHDVIESTEKLKILLDVVEGMIETADIVHRDIKPENVLWVGETWKICDFGIARFVESATSSNTVQAYLSGPYAAPEQWLGESPSKKTDIYALGCIAYEMFAGTTPFPGPGRDEYRRQHLTEVPNPCIDAPPRALSTILHMLRKLPDTRPDPQRVREQFSNAQIENLRGERGQPGLQRLRAAADRENSRKIEEQAAAKKAEAENTRLCALAEFAVESIVAVRERLFKFIIEAFPDAAQAIQPADHSGKRLKSLSIRMEKASINFEILHYYRGQVLNTKGFKLEACGWSCLASAAIAVARPGHELGATLLFSDTSEKHFRWYELGFRDRIAVADVDHSPKQFALPPKRIDDVIAGMSFIYELAGKPVAIDDENVDEFCDRWAGLFADAITGQLISPSDTAAKLVREG